MASAGGEEWIYVPTQQEDAEAEQEQAVIEASKNPDDNNDTAAADEEEKKKESNASAADEKAIAQQHPPPPEPEPVSSSESKDDGAWWDEYTCPDYLDPEHYTAEEIEVEKAWQAYTAAVERTRARRPDLDDAVDRAYDACSAAVFRREAAKVDGELEVDETLRAYWAACDRAYETCRDGDDGGAAGWGPDDARAMENSYYYDDGGYDDYDGDTYGYGGGSSAPAYLGRHLGSGYEYYNKYAYGFGFPGAAYGHATRSGFGFPGAAYGPAGYGSGYGGYGEPLCPRYNRMAAAYQAPPPARSSYQLRTPMPYAYMPPWARATLLPPPAPLFCAGCGVPTSALLRYPNTTPL